MTNKQKIKEKDLEFSLAIKDRDRRCLWCGHLKNLQCNHIISRKFKKYRYDMNNAITLCGGCHKFKWHMGCPIATTMWFMNNYPDKFNWTVKALKSIDAERQKKNDS